MTDDTENNESQESKLYANRFKSAEAMESSYLELEKSFSQKAQFESKYNEVKDYKDKYEELSIKSSVPDEYTASGKLLEIEEAELRALAEEAKGYNMTQDQFDEWSNRRIEDKSANKREPVEISDDLKKYLADSGMSENLINSFDAKDVEHYEARRQKSLDSNTNVTGGTGQLRTTQQVKRELYAKFKAVEKMGGRAADDAWNNYQQALKELHAVANNRE